MLNKLKDFRTLEHSTYKELIVKCLKEIGGNLTEELLNTSYP